MKSFGPSATVTTDGETKLSCRTGSTYCFLLVGNKCTDTSPAREIANAAETPEWCRYADGIREDVKTFADFDRMGLTDMSRIELLKMMQDVPVQYRNHYQGMPIALNAHNATMMRHAIRRMRLAEEAANA